MTTYFKYQSSNFICAQTMLIIVTHESDELSSDFSGAIIKLLLQISDPTCDNLHTEILKNNKLLRMVTSATLYEIGTSPEIHRYFQTQVTVNILSSGLRLAEVYENPQCQAVSLTLLKMWKLVVLDLCQLIYSGFGLIHAHVPICAHPRFSYRSIHVAQKYVYHFIDNNKIDHIHW